MRPTSIRLFEMSVIASQLIRIAVGLLFSGRLADVVGVPQSGLLVGTFANVAVELGLALAVSRGRMSLARWFLLAIIVLDLLNAVGLPELASVIGVPFAVFSALASLLMLAASVLMLMPASRYWIKSSSNADQSKAAELQQPQKRSSPKSSVKTLLIHWSVKRFDDDRME